MFDVRADKAVVKDTRFKKAVFGLYSQSKTFLNPVK